MEDALAEAAAWVWGQTGCFRPADAEALLFEIHDRFEALRPLFLDEIEAEGYPSVRRGDPGRAVDVSEGD